MDKNDVDESLIEATIRRVAEAKAARSAEGGDGFAPGPGDLESERSLPDAEDALESEGMPSASVAEAPPDAAGEAEAPDEESAFGPAASLSQSREPSAARAVDELTIEATIRRMEAAKAEREREALTAASEPADAPPAPALRPIAFPQRGNAVPQAHESSGDGVAAALERIERMLGEVRDTVRMLADRIGAPTVAPGPGLEPRAPQFADEARWEDEPPPVSSPGFGALPRPAIFRDIATDGPQVDTGHASPAPPPAAPEMRPAAAPPIQPERRGLDLLPRTYRITVEDKRRAVDLVPLHRALLSLEGVRDMSLLSYNNGVALVSLETVGDLDMDALTHAVSRAMSREARVEAHNERTLVVKLAED